MDDWHPIFGTDCRYVLEQLVNYPTKTGSSVNDKMVYLPLGVARADGN
jgi:hypothetical protein